MLEQKLSLLFIIYINSTFQIFISSYQLNITLKPLKQFFEVIMGKLFPETFLFLAFFLQ